MQEESSVLTMPVVPTTPLDSFPSPAAMVSDNWSGPRRKLGFRFLSKTNLSRTRGMLRSYSIGAGILSASNSIVAPSSPQLPSLPVHSRDQTASAIAYRTTSDAAQACLPPVQALAGALPGVGGTIKGVIGVVLSTIQFLDTRMQNNEDLKRLRRLLYRIRDQIDIAPPATTPTEENSRWELLRALETAKSELEAMERRIRASPTLTQDITGCINRIHNHLSRYTAFAIMNLQNDVAEVKNRMEEIVQLHAGHIRAFEDFRATFGTGQLSILSRGHAILVDATGREHPMFLEQCQNFGQLDAMLAVVLFKCRPDEAEIQRWYIEKKRYDFVIDDGRNVMQLTRESDLWSKLEPGAKIIMRVIIEEQDSTLTAAYRCRCGTLNSIDVTVENLMAALQRGCTITCRHCERRFQITSQLKVMDCANSQQEAETTPRAANEYLIRNFVVKYLFTTPHIYTPFKFLFKRNRTVSEWRDREEADRRERKSNRIRRPGVTFDLDEEPPSPAPGTSNKRKRLVRRPTGRSPTPGPPHG